MHRILQPFRKILEPFEWAKVFAIGQLWTISAIGLSNGLLILGLATAPWKRHRDRLRNAQGLWIPIVVYWVLLIGSILASSIARQTLGGIGDLLNLTPPLLAVVVLRRASALRLTIYGLVGVAVMHAGQGLFEVIQGAGGLETRIRGAFSIYMTFAGVMALALAILLAWLLYRRGWSHSWAWIGLVMLSTALLYTLTRNSWIAVLAVVTLAAFLHRGKWLFWLLPVALLAVAIVPVHVAARMWSIGDLEDISTYDRLCMLDAGAVMIRERPLLGHGPGTIDHLYSFYAHPTAPQQRVAHLHNSYASLAAEQGIPATLAVLALFLLAIRLAWRGLLHGDRDHRDLYAACLFGVVAFLVAALFEDYWADTEVQRIALMLAAVPYCLRQAVERKTPEMLASDA